MLSAFVQLSGSTTRENSMIDQCNFEGYRVWVSMVGHRLAWWTCRDKFTVHTWKYKLIGHSQMFRKRAEMLLSGILCATDGNFLISLWIFSQKMTAKICSWYQGDKEHNLLGLRRKELPDTALSMNLLSSYKPMPSQINQVCGHALLGFYRSW